MTRTRSYCSILLLLTQALILQCVYAESDPVLRIAIEREGVAIANFNAEVAIDARSRARGLMWRDELPSDSAMLFDFQAEQKIRMWMKNTLVSLDMLFASADGRIIYIERETRPKSLALVGPAEHCRYVLEILGGEAHRQNIKVGDYLIFTRSQAAIVD